MAKRQVVAGSGSVIVEIFIQDTACGTGAGKTGILWNSASLTCAYKRNKETAACAVTLASIATMGTFQSGGLSEVSSTSLPGIYEFHPPIVAFGKGAESVTFLLWGAAGMAPVATEFELTGIDVQDAMRFGLASIPNASAEAVGGIYTRGSGTGQINQNAVGQVDVRGVNFATSATDDLLDRASGIEFGITLRQSLRLTTAALAGKLSDASTTTITIRNAVTDDKARIIATVDASGNRSAFTYNLT